MTPTQTYDSDTDKVRNRLLKAIEDELDDLEKEVGGPAMETGVEQAAEEMRSWY